MALKPVIYKARVMLSDLNRDLYESLNLTIACHPSETNERMMIRLLAYCINAQDRLQFSKGLSDPDEPAILLRSDDDRISCWIDIGEPQAERLKKASHVADRVLVYSFNSKSDVWWKNESAAIRQTKAEVYQIAWESALALANMVERTMDISVTLSGDTAFFASSQGECELVWTRME